LTASEIRTIRSAAFDGFFAAEAGNRTLDARLCSLVANADDPQARQLMRSMTVEELLGLLAEG
jgi:hypothetical protein